MNLKELLSEVVEEGKNFLDFSTKRRDGAEKIAKTAKEKGGVSKFENNSVGAFDPTLNFISRATSVITSADVKSKALSQGNREIDVTIPEIHTPAWTNAWTRFPSKGM